MKWAIVNAGDNTMPRIHLCDCGLDNRSINPWKGTTTQSQPERPLSTPSRVTACAYFHGLILYPSRDSGLLSVLIVHTVVTRLK